MVTDGERRVMEKFLQFATGAKCSCTCRNDGAMVFTVSEADSGPLWVRCGLLLMEASRMRAVDFAFGSPKPDAKADNN